MNALKQHEKHKMKSNRISLGENLHNLKIGAGNLCNTGNLDSIRGKLTRLTIKRKNAKTYCKKHLQYSGQRNYFL